MKNRCQDFAAAGLRLGCLITRNKELGKAVQSLASVFHPPLELTLISCRRFHGTSPVTDSIATTILEDEEWHSRFLDRSARVLKKHRDIVARAFNDAGIPYEWKA